MGSQKSQPWVVSFGLKEKVVEVSSNPTPVYAREAPSFATSTSPRRMVSLRESSRRSSTTPAVAPHSPRSTSTSTVVAHDEDRKRVKVRLPSGTKKWFKEECRATIGIVAGGGRIDKPLLKAGRAFHKYRVKRNS